MITAYIFTPCFINFLKVETKMKYTQIYLKIYFNSVYNVDVQDELFKMIIRIIKF